MKKGATSIDLLSDEELINYIPIGKHNAIHQPALAEMVGLTTEQVKREIRKARLRGLPILSGTVGYWIASDKAEKTEFETSMRRQALARLNTVKAIRNTTTYNECLNKPNTECERGDNNANN